MRIAIVTESFPPDVNGVAHSVARVAAHLRDRGHRPLVIAPEPRPGSATLPDGDPGYPVVRVPSLPLPGYPTFRLGLPAPRIRSALSRHGTEVVHLASPFVLGAHGLIAARSLHLPTAAVYQTDVPSYATAYRLGSLGEAAAWRWVRMVHNAADITLAPSREAIAALRAHGVRRVALWRRGVDAARLHPRQRDAALRARLAPGGEVLVGYVGRLAREKRVDLLSGVAALPGVRLVIVGGGPAEANLRTALPSAVFLGPRPHAELGPVYASLDIFVHSGPYETFGQTIQEAAASGLPVVAPAAGGPVDLVEDGVTGLLVPPLSAGALAGAVARLAGDPYLRAGMGAAGRLRAVHRSWDAVGDQLVDCYAGLLGGARAVSPAVAA